MHLTLREKRRRKKISGEPSGKNMKDASSPNEPRLLSSSKTNSSRQSVAIFVCSLLETRSILKVRARYFHPLLSFPHQPLIAPAAFFPPIVTQHPQTFRKSKAKFSKSNLTALMNNSSFYVLNFQQKKSKISFFFQPGLRLTIVFAVD